MASSIIVDDLFVLFRPSKCPGKGVCFLIRCQTFYVRKIKKQINFLVNLFKYNER